MTDPDTLRALTGRMNLENKVIGYRAGSCRNNDHALSHTYAMTADGKLWPMCGYGWNRSGGYAFSIHRGPLGSQGDCLICMKNVAANKSPMKNGWPHKTKWI